VANISWDENKLNNIKTQYKNEGKMGQQGLQLLTATRKIWKTG
jgi:hypothetical protein